jgi:hypothetical protein
VDAVEPQIRELLEQWPTMPTTVIAERINTRSSSLNDEVLQRTRLVGASMPATA